MKIKRRKFAVLKTPQTLRLTPQTVERWERAAIKLGVTKTWYAELALKAQFEKDEID